jgi:hypothetical protein
VSSTVCAGCGDVDASRMSRLVNLLRDAILLNCVNVTETLEIRPGVRSVVHHLLVFASEPAGPPRDQWTQPKIATTG